MNEQPFVELLAGPTTRSMVERIRAVLWQERDGAWNEGKEWDADTCAAIAEILIASGYGPDSAED
jgi:hypothetical protein